MKPARREFEIEFIHPNAHPVRNDIAWYKWEFLRRNPEYHSDFQKFVRKYGPWFGRRGYWYDYPRRLAEWTKSDEDYFYGKIAPVILKLCQKWRIGNLFPPDWKFDRAKGTHRIPGWEWGVPTDVSAEMNWDLDFLSKVLGMGFTSNVTSGTRHRNILAAEFDLNWPMKDLVDHAKRLLAYGKKNYENELKKLGLGGPKARRRLRDYGLHLKVWDLSKRGWTPSRIAAKVFGYKGEPALGRVLDHLKAAEKLISGHYKEIS